MSDWFGGNEGQSMNAFVTSICALLALSSIAPFAQNISAADFDLASAVTAGAIFGSNPKGGAERDAAKMMWTFYLGSVVGTTRRSGNTVIQGRIAEMGEKAKLLEMNRFLYG
jgi:hypothetical protein